MQDDVKYISKEKFLKTFFKRNILIEELVTYFSCEQKLVHVFLLSSQNKTFS